LNQHLGELLACKKCQRSPVIREWDDKGYWRTARWYEIECATCSKYAGGETASLAVAGWQEINA